MHRIKVGIIGQGRSGRDIHARTLIDRLADKFEIVAVSDPLPERMEETRAETGCRTYADYRMMLDARNMDLVVNASMSHQHVPLNHEIMNAGLNVLSEKPLARCVADVDAMMATARKNGVRLAVFQQSRFATTFLKVKDIMDSGLLGRIVMVKVYFNGFARRWDWQTLQEMTAGNLLNTGPHPLDQALQFFGGDDTPDVVCHMDRVNTFGDAEDHVKIILSGRDRPVIDLEVSSCAAYAPMVYQVYGAQGGLSGDHAKLNWKYFKPEEAPPQQLIREPLPDRRYCTETLVWYEEAWEALPEALEFNCRVAAYYEDLYAAMTEGRPLTVTLAQVRRQIMIIEECHRQNPFRVF